MESLVEVVFKSMTGREYKAERVDQDQWRKAQIVAGDVQAYFRKRNAELELSRSYQGGY